MPDDSSDLPPRDIAAFIRNMTEDLSILAWDAKLHPVAEALRRARDAAAAAVAALEADED